MGDRDCNPTSGVLRRRFPTNRSEAMRRWQMKTLYALMIFTAMTAGCGGYDGPDAEQTTQGVQVTATVPYAHETIQDIIDRGELPPQGDRAMPDHRIE